MGRLTRPMRTEVVLVRHAKSVMATADGPDELERPLAPEGLSQASELTEALTALRPAAVWSSPYRRAIQTVAPTAEALGLAVRTRWDLREWDDGLPFTPDWLPHFERSWADPSVAHPGGESLDQLTRRAVGAVRELAARHPGERVLISSHGTFIARAIWGLGVRVDWLFAWYMPMPAVYRLRFDGRREAAAIAGPGLHPS